MHRATLGASVLLEQQKIHLTGNHPIRFTFPWVNQLDSCWCCSQSILNMHRADFNMHSTTFKRIQNKNDNWMSMEPKHKNFKDQYKIKERVLQIFHIRCHMSILVAFELHYLQVLLNCWHLKLGSRLKVTCYIPSLKKITSLLFYWQKNWCFFNMSSVKFFWNCYNITTGPILQHSNVHHW